MTKSFVLKISVAVLFLALISNIALPQTPPAAADKKTEIVMLGTGTPRPQPDLIFTSWVYGRSRPFGLYGPPGLARMTNHLYAAFAEDIRIRTEGLEHAPRGGYRVDVHEIR